MAKTKQPKEEQVATVNQAGETINESSIKEVCPAITEVDWKSQIPAKFLYVNNDPKKRTKIEEKYGKKTEETHVKLKILKSKVCELLGI